MYFEVQKKTWPRARKGRAKLVTIQSRYGPTRLYLHSSALAGFVWLCNKLQRPSSQQRSAGSYDGTRGAAGRLCRIFENLRRAERRNACCAGLSHHCACQHFRYLFIVQAMPHKTQPARHSGPCHIRAPAGKGGTPAILLVPRHTLLLTSEEQTQRGWRSCCRTETPPT